MISCRRDVQFQNAFNRSTSVSVGAKCTIPKVLGPKKAHGPHLKTMRRPWGAHGHPWEGPWRSCGAHAAPSGAHVHPWGYPWTPHGDPLGTQWGREGGKGILYQQPPDQPSQRPLCYENTRDSWETWMVITKILKISMHAWQTSWRCLFAPCENIECFCTHLTNILKISVGARPKNME